MGGSEGIQKRWASDNLDEKILALKQALKAGKAALESLCKNSNPEFLLVRLVASYALQHNKGDSTFEQLLQDYPLWQPVRTVYIPFPEHRDEYSSSRFSLLDCTISPDRGFLLCAGCTLDDNPHLPDTVYSWYSYVLNLKSGKKKVHLGSLVNSSIAAATPECRVMIPRLWDARNSEILCFSYQVYNWNTSQTYGLSIFSPERDRWSVSIQTIISPDGQTLFLTLDEKVLMIDLPNKGERGISVNLDVESPRIRHSLTGNSNRVKNLALTPDGRTLATCDCHGNFFIWDLQTLELRHSFIDDSGSGELLAISADGRILVSSLDKQIFIWDIESGTLKNTLTFPTYLLRSLRISPDGQILATHSGGVRGKFLFWHIPSGELLDTAPGELLSHDFQMLLSSGGGIDVWEAAEFFAAPQNQPPTPSNDTQSQATEAPNETQIAEEISTTSSTPLISSQEVITKSQTPEPSNDTQSQPTEPSNATQMAEEISTTYSNALIYSKEIIANPKHDSRWVDSLATDLDEQLLGCKIVAYKIQWFTGGWTNWYIPGINDLYQQTNLGEPVRRVWAHFNEHRHQYLSIPLDDKNSLRSFSESDRAVIPQLAGDSGVKYFEGEPANDTRWANTLSLDIDREITGHQILAYQIQLANKDWSGWLIPGYQDIYQDSQKSTHRWWAYFSHSSYRYLYME
ncbi:WD40 repeat domain-containing protein [Laspinema palackyanum]|uniref:WD40 repeat domain-containing protein n=1 Tax=Laspinema palackyanum TaxID=3231601 RepID=UPI00349F111F